MIDTILDYLIVSILAFMVLGMWTMITWLIIQTMRGKS